MERGTMDRTMKGLGIALLALLSSIGWADEPTPVPTPGLSDAKSGWADHQPSWVMPEVVVEGKRPSLKEEQLVGTYAQPRWTARRRFPSTRVYVVPEGVAQFEQWIRPTFDRVAGLVKTRTTYE